MTARGLPLVTLSLVVGGLIGSLLPGAAPLLEYDRLRVIENGEWWRLLGGQLVHWNTRMAFLDLGLLALLGAWAEAHDSRRSRLALLVAWPVIGVGIHLGAPHLATYRGASGLTTAAFVLVALLIASRAERPQVRALAVAALILPAAKIAVELWTGHALFTGRLPDGVQVTPLAHLMGAAVALAVFLTRPAATR